MISCVSLTRLHGSSAEMGPACLKPLHYAVRLGILEVALPLALLGRFSGVIQGVSMVRLDAVAFISVVVVSDRLADVLTCK
jgi:hypothetical protein